MKVELLRANIGDAKELHAMQIKAFKELLEKYQDFTFYYLSVSDSKKSELFVLLTKRKPEKAREFPLYLFCRNFKARALRRKQSGYAKKNIEMEIGNWIPSCRNPKTVIYMKK